jgi:hypothetical protein
MVTFMVSSESWRRAIMAPSSVLRLIAHDGAVAADLARNDVEAVAGGAVKKAAGIGLALAGDDGRHFLVEDADPAMAVKGNAAALPWTGSPLRLQTNFVPLYFPATISPGPFHSPATDSKKTVSACHGRSRARRGEDDCRKTKREDAKLGEHGHTCCGWKGDLPELTQNG